MLAHLSALSTTWLKTPDVAYICTGPLSALGNNSALIDDI